MDPITSRETLLRWPPPGLERVQGDLWRIASRGALSGGLLVLPLVFVLTRQQDFASLGPFADAWWMTLVFSIVGLGFAVDALGTTRQVLQRVVSALEHGYDLRTLFFVLADLKRDTGFVLQGGRHFSVMEPKERAVLANLRIASVGLFAVAGLWMSGALGALLLLGARGVIGVTTLWTVTLVPAGLCYAVGGLVATVEERIIRSARSEWFKQPWDKDLVTDDIRTWRQDLAERFQPGRGGEWDAARITRLRRLGIAIVGVGVIVAVPIFTLMPTSAIGPILVTMTAPSFARVQQRAAEVEAFRGYRLPAGEALTPSQAGELLHKLLFVGSDEGPADGELEPVARVEASWLPDVLPGNPVGAEPHRWEETIFAAVADRPSPELDAYLEGIARHESHADFARLARAADIDVAGTRWLSSFPVSTSLASVPIPRLGKLREGAWAHLALAAHELRSDRPDQAELAVRELISVGLLIGDQGPTLVDNLVGHVIAQGGGRALEQLYEVTDQAEKLAQIVALREAAARSAARMNPIPPVGVESLVRMLPAMVMNEGAVRGLRWEFFTLVTTLTPCLNLQRMVFGPDEEFERFVERAHDALVRWPSEEPLFELARAGYLGAAANAEPTILGRVLGVSMRSGPGTCGDIVARIHSLAEGM